MSPLFRNVNCTYKCTKKIKFVDSICNMSPTVAVERMHLVASFMVSTAFFCPSSVAKTTRPDEVLHVNGGSMKIFVDGQRWNEYHLENKERPISTLGRILTKRWEKNHYQKRKTHNILKRNLLLSKKKKKHVKNHQLQIFHSWRFSAWSSPLSFRTTFPFGVHPAAQDFTTGSKGLLQHPHRSGQGWRDGFEGSNGGETIVKPRNNDVMSTEL